jgi:hypothetical protein
MSFHIHWICKARNAIDDQVSNVRRRTRVVRKQIARQAVGEDADRRPKLLAWEKDH